ncbi:fungal trichothecene efflux pump [Botrytis cinerea]
MSKSSITPPSDSFDATEAEKVEHITTHDKVPGHINYYEKNGLRTYGDDEDHDHEPEMSMRRFMSLVAMAFLWTGSQIPVYIFGAIPPYIYSDIGGVDRWIWLVLANLLALAGVCPFVGSLSDILGRRYVALLGALFIVVGMIVCSTAHTMNIFIGGMAIAGIGAGINELTALAATAELAPTSKRGKYVAILVFTILPFCPSVMWAQLIASHGGWRWCGLLCGFSIIMFWPTQAFNVYGHDPIGVGVRGIPVGFSILAGACIVLWLLSVLKGRNKELMIVSSVFMTAGCGALACANRHNLSTLWALLIIAGLGIGGIVVPASIITTIICPDDLIATVSALTLSIRVIGGSIGYCIYYNVFVSKFVPAATLHIGGVMARQLNITNKTLIGEAIHFTASSLLPLLKTIPGIAGNETAYQMVVVAGQDAYAESYVYVYYASTAFGAVSILAACFLGDINAYMDDHVAVIMH